MIANIFYHTTDEIEIVRKFTVVHICAQQIAQHPAKIFVAGVRTKNCVNR
jgi:hypothetical protein